MSQPFDGDGMVSSLSFCTAADASPVDIYGLMRRLLQASLSLQSFLSTLFSLAIKMEGQ